MRRSLVTRLLVIASVVTGMATISDPAEAAVVVVPAAHDGTAIEDEPNRVFNDESLRPDGSPDQEAFVRFDVGALPANVESAILRLYVVDRSWRGPQVWSTASFTETTLRWNNRPSRIDLLGELDKPAEDEWLEFDVSDVVGGPGTYSFGLVGLSGDGADFASRQASSNRPELRIETGFSPPTTTTTTGATTTTTGATTTTSEATTTTMGVTTTTRGGDPAGGGTFTATHDAYAEEDDPNSNFGNRTTVIGDTRPVTVGLFRFDLPALSGQVDRATLRLWVDDRSSNAPEVWEAEPFSESTVDWNSLPRALRRITDLGSIDDGAYIEVDVTSAVTSGGTHAFMLIPDSSDGADFNSSEASSGRPQLVVETGGPEPSTSTSTSTSTTTVTTGPPPPGSNEAFEVGLFGDTAYSSNSEEGFLRTRDDMNSDDLELVIHVGDTWGGSRSDCPRSAFEDNRDIFDSFEAPLMYAPGDNEWEDCPESSASRLDIIRDVYFPTTASLGQDRVTLDRHSSTYAELRRWVHNGIVFATANEPGYTGAAGDLEDANVAWIEGAFDHAEAIDAAGVVVAWHDNPFSPSGGSLYRVLRERADAFGKPVVLVHGDTHNRRIDRPWSDVPNFTRVEVAGPSSSVEWIRAEVDPDSSGVFSFSIR
ncbi:MAG: DUF7594 domain-containing protein [Acidimicrobiia bacterium]